MISFVKGILEYMTEEWIIVDVNGIGYKIGIPSSAVSKLPSIGKEVKIFTHLQVKEDEMALYGFLSQDELNMFERLISVSGIGPKGALGILSTLSPADLCMAVITEDIKTLSSAPGIGKKTAQRMILELKDKINTLEAIGMGGEPVLELQQNGTAEEAIVALAALGYSRVEAAKAVNDVFKEDMSVEDIIKAALKKLALF
ncbi:Holliday junction branch migration protein RuvA [Defluviitalea saccharophila]|uniref:Holliday junction branch migration complex subunit RuvA n=1 Tax=Defluviitalea saccharophila TaxID=879970 RepID=A0ABZ2Y7Q9_9FIRM|nr:Holliday junction branch migration protein RuvA [Candidatus Epulonipiscium sp.]